MALLPTCPMRPVCAQQRLPFVVYGGGSLSLLLVQIDAAFRGLMTWLPYAVRPPPLGKYLPCVGPAVQHPAPTVGASNCARKSCPRLANAEWPQMAWDDACVCIPSVESWQVLRRLVARTIIACTSLTQSSGWRSVPRSLGGLLGGAGCCHADAPFI